MKESDQDQRNSVFSKLQCEFSDVVLEVICPLPYWLIEVGRVYEGFIESRKKLTHLLGTLINKS